MHCTSSFQLRLLLQEIVDTYHFPPYICDQLFDYVYADVQETIKYPIFSFKESELVTFQSNTIAEMHFMYKQGRFFKLSQSQTLAQLGEEFFHVDPDTQEIVGTPVVLKPDGKAFYTRISCDEPHYNCWIIEREVTISEMVSLLTIVQQCINLLLRYNSTAFYEYQTRPLQNTFASDVCLRMYLPSVYNMWLDLSLLYKDKTEFQQADMLQRCLDKWMCLCKVDS